jgi:Flp pilus assembly protein CpaB
MKIKTAFIFFVLASLACGMQTALPTQAVDVVTPSNDVSLPVKVAASQEPTESAPVYVTTAPLNVRAEANADSTILGTLEAGTVVTVFILDIRGDDCYTGEWLAIYKPIAGFVCSLYIEER